MRLFISYSHIDEKYPERLKKQLAPITGEGKLISDIWYDRDITVGDDFWDRINEHLNNRDIICLLLSPDYLASKSCLEEMKRALVRRKEEGVLVVPIILRPCGWLDVDEGLTPILAAPKDGKEISTFDNEDVAWMDVYDKVKKAVELHKMIKDIQFSQQYSTFLNDASNFAKSNPNKNTLLLDDIFVYPDVDKVERDGEAKRIPSKKLIEDFNEGDQIVIVGEDQSGKTSLIKQYIKVLRARGYYPVYIKDPMELLQGNFEYRVGMVFKEQYESDVDITYIQNNKIVAIVDDFHKCKNKQKVFRQMLQFSSCIVVVDDIYSIDAQNNILSTFAKYEIKQLKPSQRNELIHKWLLASELPDAQRVLSNEDLRRIDDASALIEESLGRVLGKGIMPSYAYFILTLLVVSEDTDRPLEEKITSQGHCYQALIVLFLKKQGVSNSNMDSYINFLSEFALRIYNNGGQALTTLQFEEFVSDYQKVFNITESLKIMLEKLDASNIMSRSTFGNYDFNYPYIYYFFTGMLLAQAWEDGEDPKHQLAVEQIELILSNLHKTSNAYIAVFIAHHTKNTALVNKILEVAHAIFDVFEPATMDGKCLSIFSTVEGRLKAPTLPSVNTPTENRNKELAAKDAIEIESDNHTDGSEPEDNDNRFALELRRSIKTVEVIGSIIKNRAGSFRSDQLENLFEEAMDVNLRFVSSFLVIVNSIVDSKEGTKFLEERIKDVHPDIDEKELTTRANMLFWSMNFVVLFSIIKKTAFSLGSASTAKVAKAVCERRNTPATFLLKHTILMWFKKNVDIEELQKMDKKLDNKTVKNAMLWLLSDYCRVHVIDYKDASRLEKMGIRRQIFLPTPEKEK